MYTRINNNINIVNININIKNIRTF